jgi:hypothetical protein
VQSLTDGLLTASILGSAVVYGTDIFCAMVLRPALAAVDDRALLQTMGNVHLIADKRMPIPGAAGWIAAALAATSAFLDDDKPAALLAALAFAALAAWMVIYIRVSAPINKKLTAARATELPAGENARELQKRWDSVIYARAGLQTVALISLCLALRAA